MKRLLEIRNVSYRYGSKRAWALRDVSFSLEPGSILGLAGPNGSGKTTLFRLILGFVSPGAGLIQLEGMAPGRYRTRHGIGYLPEQVRLPPGVRVRALAALTGRLAGLRQPDLRDSAFRLMHQLAVDKKEDDEVGALSHGYLQRVGLLVALLGNPRLVLLDEPANGLDPSSVGILRSVLRSLKRQGHGVLVSSHNLLELERVCDEILVLSHGKILGRTTRKGLAAKPDVWVVQLAATSPVSDSLPDRCVAAGAVPLASDEVGFLDERAARNFAANVTADGGTVEMIERRAYDLEFLFHFLVRQGIKYEEAER